MTVSRKKWKEKVICVLTVDSNIVCRILYSVSVSQYMYNSRITTQFLQLQHVSANIFCHHQVIIIQSLSTLSVILLLLANVYNWGKDMLLFTMHVFSSRLKQTL
jgi:hypothetical protein